MLKKTDMTHKSKTGKQESMVSSQKKGSFEKFSSVSIQNRSNLSSPLHRAVVALKKLSLGTKATMFAIAVSTIPTLAMGIFAFQLTNRSLTNQITNNQATQAIGLADNINRFMYERYEDMQILANLPILGNTNTRNKALLDNFANIYKIYDGVYIFDSEGKLIIQSPGEALRNPQEQPYFQNALKAERPVVAQLVANKIYMAAPIKDNNTSQTIGVVVAQMPVKHLAELAKSYKINNGVNYHLIDASNQNFITSETGRTDQKVINNLPIYNQLHAGKKLVSQTVFDKRSQSQQLITFAPVERLPEIPDLQWEILLTADAATVFAPQRQLFWTIAIGTGLTALIVAAIAAWLVKQVKKPILEATKTVARLGQGELDTRLIVEGQDELGVLNANINQMAAKLEVLLKDQEEDTEKAKILADIILRIRSSLQTGDIYQAAVREVQQALATNRVIIYELNPDRWNGKVIAESVSINFPKTLGVEIDDPCFREGHVEAYKQGQVKAIANIYDPDLSSSDCYIEMLEKYAVKASLIAPIINQGQLIGLMIAHHCEGARLWQQPEIDLVKQVAMQIGYALEQAKLLEEIEQARAIAEKATTEEREQKEALQLQLLELLSDVEGAASGDLTVRADVTAGEIGTVADFFNSIIESLRDIVTQVKIAATQVNDAIGTNSGAIRQLAQEALAQTTEINRTLDAVGQMTQSIQAIAENAQYAAKIAENASSTAAKSGKAMDMTVQNILRLRETVGETAKKVKRLGESTQQITRVVALINQISMQTNLLAINAGIEAARAGEEAQGFVIVAEEVGELAARSATATKEIEQIVENIQRETSEVVQAMEIGTSQVVEGTQIVEEAKESLSQILEVSRQIDDLVKSISVATATGVETSQTVSELMKQIAAISQRTSDSSLQVSESLQQTVHISQELQDTVGTFKVS